MYCPKCGSKVGRDDRFCRNCGATLQPTRPYAAPPRGALLTCASFLLIGAALVAFFSATFCVTTAFAGEPFKWEETYGYNGWPVAWGYVAFAFGVFGGILAFRRSYYLVALLCSVLVMVCGVLTALTRGTVYREGYGLTDEWLPVNVCFGLVTFALALISTTFLAICRPEFAKVGLSPKGI